MTQKLNKVAFVRYDAFGQMTALLVEYFNTVEVGIVTIGIPVGQADLSEAQVISLVDGVGVKVINDRVTQADLAVLMISLFTGETELEPNLIVLVSDVYWSAFASAHLKQQQRNGVTALRSTDGTWKSHKPGSF